MATVSKINGISVINTVISGFTYDNVNTLTISQSDGTTFPVSINELYASVISGGTLYGDGSNLTGIVTTDNYVTGGTLVGNTLVLNRTDALSAVTVDFSQFLDDTNTFVTGATLTNNSLVVGRNDGQQPLTISGGTNVTITEPISGTFKIDSTGGGSGTITKNLVLNDEQMVIDTAGRATLTTTTTGFVSFVGAGAPDEAGTTFQIPEDYNSTPEFSLWWTMDGTSTDQGRILLNITTGRTELELHTDIHESIEIFDNGYSGTSWRILKSAYSGSTLSYNPGDYIHVQLSRDPGDADDTLADTMYVSALVFRYLANT